MKKHEAYPSKYLKAADISGPTKATVSSVSHEAMTDGKLKPVVFLAGFQKAVVVNATNADVLYALAGSDDEVDWPGITVELYTEMARSPDGKIGPAIRFRAPPQRRAAGKLATAETPNDEIPL